MFQKRRAMRMSWKLPHGLLQGYFDYDQALRVSKALKKPVFVDFTGHGYTNCREMENRVWSDQGVLGRLRENFVLVVSYVDDKVVEMPKEEWYTSKKRARGKTVWGKRTRIYKLLNSAPPQPYYVILDSDGKLLVSPKAYDLNVENFKKFLMPVRQPISGNEVTRLRIGLHRVIPRKHRELHRGKHQSSTLQLCALYVRKIL